MNAFFKPTVVLISSIFLGSVIALTIPVLQNNRPVPIVEPSTKPAGNAKIQAAILLDVSNSMDGLIDQAKAQLWNMVNTMGKATCDGNTPMIEIALYEYGRPSNDIKNGFVKQISPFTSNLDELSRKLFSLTTNGGDEFCGQVMFNSLNELNWDTSTASYKVIFIAGNEDFLQGKLPYTKACALAKQKSVIINSIYCGDKSEGIREHWNITGECGTGSYTNIDQNQKIEEIPTPYDDVLLTLNEQLNGTYIGYGYAGFAASETQKKMDSANFRLSKTVAVKRAEVKGNKGLYQNESWDMVDASTKDEKFVDKLDRKSLPDSLKNKSTKELKQIIDQKKEKREALQAEIGKTAAKRDSYIAAEKAKSAVKNQSTLETEIEKIIRKQAGRYNMKIR